jgi:4'-phosphopantetheinyl transferase
MDLHWLVQSWRDYLETGDSPALSWLQESERAHFQQHRTAKRRHDWLLGRWTAKQLIRTAMSHNGQVASLTDFCITNNADGVPYVVEQPDWSLSISHAGDYALCALTERPAWPLGADIEHIQPRQAPFVEDYFTHAEQATITQASSEMTDTLVTAIWSAKEAALKALRVGLSVDTRAVTCLLQTPLQPPDNWQSAIIRWDAQRFNRPLPIVTGWWRVMGNYVLTLAVQAAEQVQLIGPGGVHRL